MCSLPERRKTHPPARNATRKRLCHRVILSTSLSRHRAILHPGPQRCDARKTSLCHEKLSSENTGWKAQDNDVCHETQIPDDHHDKRGKNPPLFGSTNRARRKITADCTIWRHFTHTNPNGNPKRYSLC